MWTVTTLVILLLKSVKCPQTYEITLVKTRCYLTGPALIDIQRETEMPIIREDNKFWCLEYPEDGNPIGHHTLDAVVEISASSLDTHGNASIDAYRAYVAVLTEIVDSLELHDCVWNVIPVDFTEAPAQWKISFDRLSLSRQFKLKEVKAVKDQLATQFRTIMNAENFGYKLQFIEIYEKFAYHMCGAPFLKPKCESKSCLELKSYEDYESMATKMRMDVYELDDIDDKCAPGDSVSFLVLQRTVGGNATILQRLLTSNVDEALSCNKVLNVLSRQRFWFRDSVSGCAESTGIPNMPALRIDYTASSLGPANFDSQCLDNLAASMTKAINTLPDGTVIDQLRAIAVVPLLPLVADDLWFDSHQKNPLMYNPICFKEIDQTLTEIRLETISPIKFASKEFDNEAIKKALIKDMSQAPSLETIPILKIEFDAFKVTDDGVSAQFNLIVEPASLTMETVDAIQSYQAIKDLGLTVSMWNVSTLHSEVPKHKFVVTVNQQVTVVSSSGNAETTKTAEPSKISALMTVVPVEGDSAETAENTKDTLEKSKSIRNSGSVLETGMGEASLSRSRRSVGEVTKEPENMELVSQTVMNSLQHSVETVNLTDSLLAIKVDKCIETDLIRCDSRLTFDLFQLSQHYNSNDLELVKQALTNQLKSRDGFTVKDVSTEFSNIITKALPKRFQVPTTTTKVCDEDDDADLAPIKQAVAAKVVGRYLLALNLILAQFVFGLL